jgi:membrane-bound lytic murein transglycosylase B
MKALIQAFFSIYLLTTLVLSSHAIRAEAIHPACKALVQRLLVDGVDEKYLRDVFSHPQLKLMPKAVAKSLIRKEAELNYAQFLAKDSVDKAIFYLKIHRRTLDKMERHFSISAPLVVAILCVETACGTYTGKFKTVNILATQALSLEPQVYKQIYDQIASKDKSNLTPQEIKGRLRKKSVRAYRELKALLAYARNHDTDPFSLKGSIEGAIGLPQFLPSNIKRFGFDGNNDGKIDLFQPEDAIPSVASYLKAYNWREEHSYGRKKQIIRNYNPSEYYATTVLELADRLAGYWH